MRVMGDGIRAVDDDGLLDRLAAGRTHFPGQDAAAAELQRRLLKRLTKSVDHFSQESGKHSRMMLGLTAVIAVLTVVLLLQGFGYLPLVRSTSPTPEGSGGERVSDVEGIWDEHAAGQRSR